MDFSVGMTEDNTLDMTIIHYKKFHSKNLKLLE